MKRYLFFPIVAVMTMMIYLGAQESLISQQAQKRKMNAAQVQFDRHVKGHEPPLTSVVHKQFNFHIAAPGIWRSSQPNAESLLRMKKHGLKTIINLRTHHRDHVWEQAFSNRLGLSYYRFPMNALLDQDDKKLKNILDIMSDPANQPVLIHCHAGKDRTGLVIGLYKLMKLGYSYDHIHQEMLMYGYDESAFPAIINTVKKWQNSKQ